MTRQEMFDKVVTHLLTQKCRAQRADSSNTTRCYYRGDNNTKCAIGCLIPDDVYRPEMENCIAPRTLVHNFHLSEYIPFIEMTSALQTIHDTHDCSRWEDDLRNLATRWVLKFNPPSSEGAIT